MHFVAIGQALDSDDRGAVRLDCKHEAGPGRLAAEKDRAGAADTVFASEMGAGEPDVFADDVGERAAGFDVKGGALAVDGEGDRMAHAGTPVLAAASARPQRVRTPAICRR